MEVGGIVKDLDTVAVGTVEKLVRGVGRVGDIASRWMPVGIDTEAECLVGLGVVSGDRSIVLSQQCGAMRSSDVKAHIRWVSPVEAVAVDATLELCVLNQRPLVEGGEVAFVNAHLAPYLVARLDQAVADAVVDAVGADVHRERAIGVPSIGILGRNGDGERVSRVLGE